LGLVRRENVPVARRVQYWIGWSIVFGCLPFLLAFLPSVLRPGAPPPSPADAFGSGEGLLVGVAWVAAGMSEMRDVPDVPGSGKALLTWLSVVTVVACTVSYGWVLAERARFAIEAETASPRGSRAPRGRGRRTPAGRPRSGASARRWRARPLPCSPSVEPSVASQWRSAHRREAAQVFPDGAPLVLNLSVLVCGASAVVGLVFVIRLSRAEKAAAALRPDPYEAVSMRIAERLVASHTATGTPEQVARDVRAVLVPALRSGALSGGGTAA
jgi:hypothetical protein